jgi:hypothetical protein
MRRYRAGMNEVKANEIFKQQIIKRVKESSLNQSSHMFKIKRLAVLALAVSLFILVTMFGVSYYLDDNKAANTIQADFHGIYITGFTTAGPVQVKPNVSFGQYSRFMSSSPAFPLQIECVDADRIRLQAAEGSFISWSPLTSKIDPKGQEVDIQSGDKIYYNPGANSTRIEIIAFKNNKELGRKTIEITSKDDITYTGMLLGEDAR